MLYDASQALYVRKLFLTNPAQIMENTGNLTQVHHNHNMSTYNKFVVLNPLSMGTADKVLIKFCQLIQVWTTFTPTS